MINVYFSYDYELLWGVWRGASPRYIRSNIAQANTALAAILLQHQRHKIPAHIGITGAVLDGTRFGDIPLHQGLSHELKTHHSSVNAEFGDKPELTKTTDWILRRLKASNYAVLGSHTHSHIFALEQNRERLRLDFKRQADLFASKLGAMPAFLIMPKNQVTDDVLQLATEFEIPWIRCNPQTWLYAPEKRGKLIRILRFLDSFLPILELLRVIPAAKRAQGCIEGRFFFRPKNRFAWMDRLHLWRLKLGYVIARQRGLDFHVWSHPHNFGGDVDRATQNLAQLLSWLEQKQRRDTTYFPRLDHANADRADDTRGKRKQAI